MKFSVRLSREDERRLEEMADKRNMTPSDLVREMIRTGYDHQVVSQALKEIRAAAGSLAAQERGSGGTHDVAEIRRIVTLIARAMPSVAKHV